MYHKHPVTITKAQFGRLRNGHTVQLKPHQIGHGLPHKHHLMLHPMNFKKVQKAARGNKGVRLSLTPQEFQASGEGFMDFINKIKDAGRWVKKNVIDTDFYQKNIKPVVHGLVDQGINTASALIGSKTGPQGQQIAGDAARAAANKFFDATGAGMAIRGGYHSRRYGHGATQGDVRMSARDVRKVIPQSEFTPLLSPTKYPSIIQHQMSVKGRGRPKGGSFRLN